MMKSIRCGACGYAGWWDSHCESSFPCPSCGDSNWVTDRKDEIPDPLKAAYSVALSYLDIYGRAVIRIRLRDGQPSFSVLHSLSAAADEALDDAPKASVKDLADDVRSDPVRFTASEFGPGFSIPDISNAPLEDMADDARDRRLQALEETVSLLLAKQDRMVGKMNKEVDPPLVFPGSYTLVRGRIGEYPPPYGYSPGMDHSSVKDIRKLQKLTRKLVKAKPPTKRKKR